MRQVRRAGVEARLSAHLVRRRELLQGEEALGCDGALQAGAQPHRVQPEEHLGSAAESARSGPSCIIVLLTLPSDAAWLQLQGPQGLHVEQRP